MPVTLPRLHASRPHATRGRQSQLPGVLCPPDLAEAARYAARIHAMTDDELHQWLLLVWSPDGEVGHA